MKTRGVIIMAAGHAQYGQMALTLAMGIKHCDPQDLLNSNSIKVCLAYHGGATGMIQHYMNIFDDTIEIPQEYVTRNGFESLLKAKCYLYELSPYDETIYIDADVIWSPKKKISALFEELKDLDFTVGTRNRISLKDNPRGFQWADGRDIIKKYGFDGDSYNLSSEFMYFKKTKKIQAFFKAAQSAFEDPGVDYKRFAAGVPDELAFQIAMMQTGIKPHKDQFLPFYWEPYMKMKLQPKDLYDAHWGYSIGGSMLSDLQKGIYNALSQYYAKQYGLKRHFPCRSKREWSKFRTQI